ncbi:DUF2911 domain-containing protein [Kaistella antarctica]|uniref:Protein of uncharacterized function (DUF2911) n=1 Tax=Kaistella antarctica TaxID=266748 RepID=A0A448NN91_9FLAO|nr:DUF2911 domain-containing protein [Kaistella antarctica]KEY19839.1 hypothetical protein HY04_01015 [Kaistella antarctica]SEV97003.1 Protein of unknown function [Kaistella antarctica]VEH96347.1 Protein of uncharacterised function (DUF2911) [Kaistella antarctica]
MKKILFTALLSWSFLGFSQYNVPIASPRQKVEQQFSMTKISVDYSRPGVKGRKVFGELVPYGKVWRAGANSATKITFEQNVNFGGKDVMAGTYGLFVVPMEKEWKVILNKDANQWGAYTYDEKLNIAEVMVPVQKLGEKQEWFEVAVNPMDIHSAEIIIKWDMTKVVIPVKEAKPEVVTKIIDKLNEIKQIEKDAAPKK